MMKKALTLIVATAKNPVSIIFRKVVFIYFFLYLVRKVFTLINIAPKNPPEIPKAKALWISSRRISESLRLPNFKVPPAEIVKSSPNLSWFANARV